MSRIYPLLYAVMFLAFFNLLAGLIETTYAFALLQTDIPPEIGFVLFILSPFLLLAYPRPLNGRAARTLAVVTGLLALAAWALAPWLDTRGKLLASAAGTGLWMLFLPALLRLGPIVLRPHHLGRALGLAGLALILLHALDAGLPLGGMPARVISGLLAGLGMVLFCWFPTLEEAPPAYPRRVSFARLTLTWLGLLSALLLLYFGLVAPAVMTRWTSAPGLLAPLLAAAALALLVGVWSLAPARLDRLPARFLLAWNALFVVTLAGALLPHQVAFPIDPAGYPLAEPPTTPLAWAALAAMLLLHPVVYVDFARLGGWLARSHPAPRVTAGGLSLAAVLFMLAIFGNVSTTAYDYIPLIGPWFRDRFWLVVTVPALILTFAAVWAGAPPRSPSRWSARRWLTAAAAGALACAIGVLLVLSPAKPAPPPAQDSLRILTYNIQQGYDASGQPAAAAQLQVIQAQQPDLVGLQESDMARIANGNADIVGYFASHLDMYAYYGPKTVTGTFGVALLSRYPIENPRTFYMFSEGEQTAALAAEIQAGPRRLTVIVTHLGNGGPLVQQQQVLEAAAGLENVILVGDFNFRPDTEQYRLTTASLVDAWLAAGEQGSELPPGELDRRIDHVFLSPGLPVRRAHYLAEGPSDHPPLVVDISLAGE